MASSSINPYASDGIEPDWAEEEGGWRSAEEILTAGRNEKE